MIKIKSAAIGAFTAAMCFATAASAGSFGTPCTVAPKEHWMTLDAIKKIVREHGYQVNRSKMKNACAEIYTRDRQGNRVEFFIDPVSGNPVGTDWTKPAG